MDVVWARSMRIGERTAPLETEPLRRSRPQVLPCSLGGWSRGRVQQLHLPRTGLDSRGSTRGDDGAHIPDRLQANSWRRGAIFHLSMTARSLHDFTAYHEHGPGTRCASIILQHSQFATNPAVYSSGLMHIEVSSISVEDQSAIQHRQPQMLTCCTHFDCVWPYSEPANNVSTPELDIAPPRCKRERHSHTWSWRTLSHLTIQHHSHSDSPIESSRTRRDLANFEMASMRGHGGPA